MTWWDLQTAGSLVGAFVGAALAVILFRRPPRVLRDLAEGELHITPHGVHVVPPGELPAHIRPTGLRAPGEPEPQPGDIATDDCECRPRRERLRTVEILVHQHLEPRL